MQERAFETGERAALVVVVIEGGAVQDVSRPAGVKVVVKDYDVEGVPAADLKTDDAGDLYLESMHG